MALGAQPDGNASAGDVPLSAQFARALQFHQAGRLAEAERLYRQILAIEPGHSESLHLLGVIACQCGQAGAAAELIEGAIRLRGDVAVYHYNLGLALQSLGRTEAAIAGFERAVALQPDYVEAQNNRAALLLAQGRLDAAADGFERALALKPDHVEACFNLGVARLRQNRPEAAVRHLEQALALRSDHPEAWCHLGLALERLDRLAPAAAAFERALTLRPEDAEALHGLGAVRQRQERLDEAAACFERAVAVQPGRAAGWYALGSVRHRQSRPDDAAGCYERAIALRPDDPGPYANLALILKDRGDLPAALALLDRALALQPDHAEAQLNQAMIRLLAGDFAAGWRQYEWRWQTRQLDPDRRSFTMPRWDGSAGNGRTILLWAEQGLGDTLQICRYAPLVAARGWRVVVAVPASLTRLLRSLPGVSVQEIGAPPAAADCHCPLMSLPLLFGTRVETVPAAPRYLAADPADVARRRPLLAAPGAVLTVGLAWAGNPGVLSAMHQGVDRRRSIPLGRLAPLLAVEGVRFVSLQKDRRAGERPESFGLLDIMDEVRDFADTAAIIAALDLVITVDTAIVHLAGALGKPVWLLNRFDPCWRWLLGRDDSPWYPGLRQFRQTAPGDWSGPIAAAAAALAARVATR
jgi:tetratricopeptide (TPR) repeat protein